MELFSAQFFSTLIAIIIIDLVLAGDNAIVIAIAARNVSKHLQKRAIVWGTVGAIVVRAVMTLFVVWLLQIPGLLLAGGLLLIWIAYSLVAPAKEKKSADTTAATFWSAMKTIVIADAVMGFDNVLGVAGAAHESFLLVIVGLLISVPIVVWGSTLILGWIERFPALIYIGASVLAWTSAKMITDEPMLEEFLGRHELVVWTIYVLVIGGVLYAGYAVNKRKKPARSSSKHSSRWKQLQYLLPPHFFDGPGFTLAERPRESVRRRFPNENFCRGSDAAAGYGERQGSYECGCAQNRCDDARRPYKYKIPGHSFSCGRGISSILFSAGKTRRQYHANRSNCGYQ